MEHSLRFLFAVVLCFGASSVSARRINITMLDNCRDMVEKPQAYVTKVSYHIDPEDGLCDKVHTTLKIETLDSSDLELFIELFKCEGTGMDTPCNDAPTTHTELLTCERLMNDDSGPWHMFTSVMEDDTKCGKKTGEFELEFVRLRLEHLVKYLDVYDSTYNTFRLKMNFKSTGTNALRGCGELDFTLLAI